MARKRRQPGRPPQFPGGFARTKHWLKLTKAEWEAIDKAADLAGLSFREFVKRRLRGRWRNI